MTTFAVNYGWTPEAIAQDRALKEKYGQSAYVIPIKTYPALEKSPSVDRYAGKKENKKSGLKNFLFGAATIALSILAYKKGAPKVKELFRKTKLPKVITGDPLPNTLSNMDKAINEFKNNYKGFASVKPTITKLKNGGTKVEFKRPSEFGGFVNEMLVFDKTGKFTKRIRFANDAAGKVGAYKVLDGVTLNSKELKSAYFYRDPDNIKSIDLIDNLKKERKEILVKAEDGLSMFEKHTFVNDKHALLEAMAIKKTGDSAEAYKHVVDNASHKLKSYFYKPGQPKKEVDPIFYGLIDKDVYIKFRDFLTNKC